jgi:hypothetical protein
MSVVIHRLIYPMQNFSSSIYRVIDSTAGCSDDKSSAVELSISSNLIFQ